MRGYFVLQGHLAVSEGFLYVTAEGRFLHPVGSDAVNHPTPTTQAPTTSTPRYQ